jgi:hypothetical protein
MPEMEGGATIIHHEDGDTEICVRYNSIETIIILDSVMTQRIAEEYLLRQKKKKKKK